jgi:hypothetical protein
MAQTGRRGKRRVAHSVTCLVFLLVGLPPLQASTSRSNQPSVEESSLRLTARASRTQDLLGLRFGIYADLENTSRIPLFLHPRYLTLTSPPELTYHDQSLVRYAYCPGPPADEYLASPEEKLVRLDPGDKITCFWDIIRKQLGAPKTHRSAWSMWMDHAWFDLSFPPGQYTFIIVVNYWADPAQIPLLSPSSFRAERTGPNEPRPNRDELEPDPTDPSRKILTAAEIREISIGEHKTETSNVMVTVAAAEWVVLSGAMLGGAFAFALIPSSRLYPRSTWKGLFSAMMLSAIATILLSRLSETQFVIRVTVNDFWGAVAVGFVVGSTGRAVLERFLQLLGKSRDS